MVLRRAAIAFSAIAMTASGMALAAAPAQASRLDASGTCVSGSGVASASARSTHGSTGDTRGVSAAEAKAIESKTQQILAKKGFGRQRALASASIPVYIHVMRSSTGAGDVTATQINNQIAELNQDYAGGESSAASNTGFSFYLAGTDRFNNDTWHTDGASTTYRSQTRKGGANALNIWLVDFDYLGIATFPWDYAKSPKIDGIRVQYSSLPGGSATNYNQGKTASHEAGHWFGLYHTFQGGCTSQNDLVSDTPAQSSASSGCPTGRDSCSLSGLDPIHNYMDYSYDACYNQFTPGQSTRMSDAWSAYRG